MTRDKLRAGVIGAGDVAMNVHLPTYASDERLDLIAVADLDDKRRQAAKVSFDIPSVFENGATLLEEAELDLVSICTPVMTHEDLFLTAADAGIDIFCVKPFAESLESAQRMHQAAKSNGIIAQIGYMYRFTKNFERAKSYAQNGLMGEIKALNTSFHSRPPEMGWYYDKEFPGGGTLKRIFSHHLDYYLDLFGVSPTIERAVIECNRTDSVEDYASVELLFGDTTVTATLSDMQQSYTIHQNDLIGTDGAITFNQDRLSGDVRGNVVEYKHGDPPDIDFVFKQFWFRTSDNYKPKRVTDFVDHIVSGNKNTAAPTSRGVEVTRITKEIYEKGGI